MIEYGTIYVRGAQPEAYPGMLSRLKILRFFGVTISSQSVFILGISLVSNDSSCNLLFIKQRLEKQCVRFPMIWMRQD